MHLSMKALTIVTAILWGGGVLFTGLVNLAVPSYGTECLRLMSSVYPGFHFSRTFGDVLVGTSYGLVDGAIAGFLFGWLYNFFAGRAGQA
jgi:hypothetical protein